jgi:ATP/ADP translocase
MKLLTKKSFFIFQKSFILRIPKVSKKEKKEKIEVKESTETVNASRYLSYMHAWVICIP